MVYVLTVMDRSWSCALADLIHCLHLLRLSCYLLADELSDSGSELNFSHISGAILVQQHGLLRFVNITLADIAPFTSYQYGPAQPYRNAGLGWGLWPTITLAPGGQVRIGLMDDVGHASLTNRTNK